MNMFAFPLKLCNQKGRNHKFCWNEFELPEDLSSEDLFNSYDEWNETDEEC